MTDSGKHIQREVRRRVHAQRGFSMVDLLVGIAVGILGMLAVTKVLMDFNQRRNTSVQLMETQNNGAMAMYLVERDLGQAGYGMMQLQNCSGIQWYFTSERSSLSPVPVSITDGGTSSDAITIQYANNTAGVPAVTVTQNQGTYTDAYTVASIAGFSGGDLVVANSNNVCTMTQVTSVNNVAFTIAHTYDAATPGNTPYIPDPTDLPADSGTAWHSDAAGATQATVNNLLAGNGSQLINLGQFTSKSYTVAGNTLRTAAFPGYAASPLVDGVVLMKAQYGIDTGGDGAVDNWSSGAAFTVSNTNSNQVIAVRVGFVVRSPLLEKEIIAQPATLTVLPDTTDGVADNSVSYTIPTASSGDHYRYKTYYSIIPLRNVIWGR